MDELEEPEAKASLIWIIGEYANKIDNADALLGFFVDAFTEESYAVSFFSQNLDPLSRCGPHGPSRYALSPPGQEQ